MAKRISDIHGGDHFIQAFVFCMGRDLVLSFLRLLADPPDVNHYVLYPYIDITSKRYCQAFFHTVASAFAGTDLSLLHEVCFDTIGSFPTDVLTPPAPRGRFSLRGAADPGYKSLMIPT